MTEKELIEIAQILSIADGRAVSLYNIVKDCFYFYEDCTLNNLLAVIKDVPTAKLIITCYNAGAHGTARRVV